MIKFRTLMLVPVGALMSCGAVVDNSENVPDLGRWSDETRLLSVQVNGAAIDPSKSGLPMPEQKKSELACREPYVRKAEDFLRVIQEDEFLRQCSLDYFRADATTTHVTGVCKLPSEGGTELSGEFSANGREKADRVDIDYSFKIYGRKSTGEGEVVNVESRRTFTRLGDC
jgi:hypothetical protein